MNTWQITTWNPAIAILDCCGSLHYYPVVGEARHAHLAGGFNLNPHEPDSRISFLLTLINGTHMFFLVKTMRSIKNEEEPCCYKLSKDSFDRWAKGEATSLWEYVQDASDEEWLQALRFSAEAYSKTMK